MRFHRHVYILGAGIALCAGLAFTAEACSSDDPAGPAASDAAAPDTSTPKVDGDSGGPVDGGGGGGDAADAADASDGSTGVVTYTIPAGGGSVSVTGATTTLALAFPASAAGLTVTLKSTTAASIGWSTEFTDVITLGPDGTVFADPVVVTPGDKHLLLFSSPSGAGKQRLEALPLAVNGAGFELRHFSSLAVVDPAQSCTSTTGWNAAPNDPGCTRYGGANTTRLSYGCKALQFCQYIYASCCVPPGTSRTDCELGDNNLYVEYVQNGGDATSAAYCGDAGAKPSCGAITTTGGATADCSASMTVNGNVYVAECSSAGGQSCRCTKNGALGGGSSTSYTAGGDNCGVAAAIRVTNNCNAGVCQ